jgi:peptide methionine sulfoxide reductase MsrB
LQLLRILRFSRHYAEHSGYFEKTSFVTDAMSGVDVIHFYDSNTGKLLYTAPQGRSMEDFLQESRSHGWPSFRDAEVNWENVRCLKDGETVSVDGTHLGHNLPDKNGSRYCINLVSVAAQPAEGQN